MNREQKLERWAEKQILESIHNLIIDDEEGGWVVFGCYYLTETDQGYNVHKYSSSMGTFASKRSAVSWCVADKNRQLNLAITIKKLDMQKSLVAADIECRRSVANRSRDPLFRETVRTKIEPKITYYKSVSAELEKCINSAKYLQLRGFSNEIARTGRA
jgi:hypothetical protein